MPRPVVRFNRWRRAGERLRLVGELSIYERPSLISLDEFLSHPGSGRLAAREHNIVTNQLYVDLLNTLAGSLANPMQVTALALGTGVLSSVSRLDTTMALEWNRYAPISQAITETDPPSLSLSFFSPATDGVAAITEAGLWASGATLVQGSGLMYSHIQITYSKTATTDVTMTYTLTRDSAV
jgi:hypothetical protein